ncbi:MAG: hypothetical protein QXQ39_05820 [Conexivisphaerales archaeon]
MAKSSDAIEKLLKQVIVDIKGVMLLHESDTTMKEALNRIVSESHDEDVRHFFKLIGEEYREKVAGSFVLIAIGEMVISSILIIAGLALLAPIITGLNNINQLYQYFTKLLYYLFMNTQYFPLLKLLDFILAALLLLSAVYTLRYAALSLARAGIEIKSSDESVG